MAISTTTNTVLLAGNSSTVVFPYSFPFYNLTDPKVYLFDTVLGGITPQVLNSNYSIAATADSTGIYPNGGNIIFTSSVINTTIVVIDRQPIETQTFAILQNGFISSVGLTHQLDYLTLLIQDMADRISRAVTLPTGFGQTNTFNPQLPSNIAAQSTLFAGCFLAVNSTATGLTVANSSFIPYTPAASGYVLTGNGPNAFPSFSPIVLSGSSVTGQLSLGNGGTGGLVPSEWGVVYASSATQLATTAPGPIGFPLVANASSAPAFQAISYTLAGSGVIPVTLGGTGLGSAPPNFSLPYIGSSAVYAYLNSTGAGQILTTNASSAPSFQPISINVASGILQVAAGGTGKGAYSGNFLIQSGSGGTSVIESPFVTIGSSLQVGDGSTTVPSIGFINEPLSGFYRSGAGDIVQLVNGSQVAEYLKVGTQVNVGFGPMGTVSASNSIPFSIAANNNQPDFFSIGNLSAGTSSASLLQFFNGPSSNYVYIGNFANSTASNATTGNGYLNGGGWIGANNNMTQMVLSSDFASSFISFAVGGHALVNEKARFTTTAFSLTGGTNIILNGTGASSMQLTLPSSMAARYGDMVYCGSGGVFSQLAVGSSGTILQSNGIGAAPSWIGNSALTNPMTTLGDTIYGAAAGSVQRLAGITSNSSAILIQTGSGASSSAPSWRTFAPPLISTLTSGSNYFPPSGALYLRVRGVGGGGGGQGGGSGSPGNGTSGSNTVFAFLIGTAGGSGGSGAGAGTGTGGDFNNPGYPGEGTGSLASSYGGIGGGSLLGGGALGGTNGAGTGVNAGANTGGGGGGGGGGTAVTAGIGGCGGGYFEKIISGSALTSNFAYIIGAGGPGGAAGTSGGIGGNGGSGIIVVEAHFQ